MGDDQAPGTRAPAGWSRQATCGLLGLVLSAGAPVGLLLLRLATGRASLRALAAEWRAEDETYLYVALSTAVVFTCFGALLGRASDRLVRLATVDALTGLLNRGGLARPLEVEAQRARRYGQPLSVLLIDVDGLKQINDRHGHAAGDDALRAIARAIARGCRATDVPGRWGGDEFLVVAPATPAADAQALASRIREAVRRLPGPPAVSVSVGAASAEPDAPLAALLTAADDRLYEAKAELRR